MKTNQLQFYVPQASPVALTLKGEAGASNQAMGRVIHVPEGHTRSGDLTHGTALTRLRYLITTPQLSQNHRDSIFDNHHSTSTKDQSVLDFTTIHTPSVLKKILSTDFETREDYQLIKDDYALTITVLAAIHKYPAQRGTLRVLSQALLLASAVETEMGNANKAGEESGQYYSLCGRRGITIFDIITLQAATIDRSSMSL